MKFFTQRGLLAQNFCKVLLYTMLVWNLKPAVLKSTQAAAQWDAVWLFSTGFYVLVLADLISAFLLINNRSALWKSHNGELDSETFAQLRKAALYENQSVSIDPKLASVLLVGLALWLTISYGWCTFLCG